MASGSRHRIRRRLIAGCLLAGALVAASWSVSRAGTALVVYRPVERADAIIILASHEWERLPAAEALARDHIGAAVLLTVPRVITDSNCDRCGERRQWLIERGLAPARIHELRDRVANTYDEAVAARNHADRQSIRRLAIVTSPYHTRRAFATFREVFASRTIEIGVYPACGSSPARPAHWWASAYDRAYVTYEWAAGLQFRFKFGIPITVPAGSDLPPGLCSCVFGAEGIVLT